MSCSLPVFAYIEDISRVVSFLGDLPPSSEQNGKNNQEETWQETEDWGWTDTLESETLTASGSWLQDCCISLSPSNDTLVLAKDDKAVFLASKWKTQSGREPSAQYEIVWSGNLAVEEGECINNIICIPIASQHRSSQGSPDWTCIVAGFTSGYMRIYLQNGSLLLSQLLHDDPVLKFKCRTWQPYKNYGNAEQVEELAILYPSALVVIDGFSLYQSLRACRNQLARAQASRTSELIQPPPLAYKKWKFEGQKDITDIASCGVVPPCLFDQLQAASFIGGFNATIRSNFPATFQFVTTGMKPFVAVYTALESSSPPLISDVALEVASRLTTAVLSKLSAASGWLGWGSKPTNQSTEASKRAKPKVENGTYLPARFGLNDCYRNGTSISLAPSGRLAVTTDDFGRVMLLDIKKAIVVRLWKGYRDAQCGWVVVEEEDHQQDEDPPKTSLRTALFLVIYATKRGILEIWRTEQGPRVAAFNIGKACRLLYTGHGIMGLGHVIRQGQARPQHTLNCTLLLPDGTLKTFSVPFHCALSDKHSRRVRDLHLLKKLSSLLDKAKLDQDSEAEDHSKVEAEVLEVLGDIQTPQLQQQGLQCLLSNVGIPVSVLLKAVEIVSEKVKKQNNKPDGDHEEEVEDTEILHVFCDVQRQLLETHASVLMYKEEPGSVEKLWKGKSKELCAAEILGLTKSEATELLSELSKDWISRQCVTSKHHAQSESQLKVTSFLSCFEFVPVQGKPKDGKTVMSDSKAGPSRAVTARRVGIRKGLSNDMIAKLSNFLFKKCLCGHSSAGRLAIPFDLSGIKPSHLMHLLVFGWLSNSDGTYDTVSAMIHLHSLVSTITSLQGSLSIECHETQSRDNTISPWWDSVRHTLAQSSAIGKALSLAAVCRGVAMEISTASKKVQGEGDEAESRELAAGDWVSVSVEMERWNLLVCQLGDLLALKSFIDNLPSLICGPNNTDKQENSCKDTPELSVIGFLSSGHGAASQVLSKYIVQYEVPPCFLGVPSIAKHMKSQDDGEPGNEDQPEVEPEPASHIELEDLVSLRLKFPHSLQQDVLWGYCAMECATYWENNKEETNKLFLALEHLRCIHCAALQHGLVVMLWKRQFKEKVSATVLLMEKVGKAPKDRLCRKTVELSYSAVEQFLKATLQLLDLISEADWKNAELVSLETEDFWHTGEESVKSIIAEAQEQAQSIVPLVELHIKLVTVQWIIMGLEMKSIKPLSLFDTMSKDSFMRDLSSSRSVSSDKVDKAIIEAREKFLSRAMSFAVQNIPSKTTHQVLRRVDSDNDNTGTTAGTSNNDWPLLVLKLAEQFGMDSDPLKGHYVRELFSAGLDEIAKEAMYSVRDQRSLGSQLLKIVGQRLAHVILHTSGSSERVNRLSRLPTQISSWIKSQDPSKLLCPLVPLSHTVDLLNIVVSLTSEESQEFPLTSGLAESIKFML